MAELILKIGSPIKVVNNNYIALWKCYYLGNGFVIYSFDPNIIAEPELYISHLSEYGSNIRIYPYENIDYSTFSKSTLLPRYRNSVGEYLNEDDFSLSNLRDFNLIDDCHLNEFPWFEKIKKIIREKLAQMKTS